MYITKACRWNGTSISWLTFCSGYINYQRFSSLVFDALCILLKRNPPPVRATHHITSRWRHHVVSRVQGKRLLVIGTTSCLDDLEQIKLSTQFKKQYHVSTLTDASHLLEAVKRIELFNDDELQLFARRIQGKTLVSAWLIFTMLLVFRRDF